MGVRHTRRGKQKMMMSDAHTKTQKKTSWRRFFDYIGISMTEDFCLRRILVRHFVFEKTAIKWKAVDDSRASWLFGVCDETVCRFVLWERFSPIFWPDSGARLFSLWHNLHQMCRERTETNGNQQRTSRSRNTRLLQQVNGVSSFLINRRTAGNHTLVGSRLTARNSSASESKQNKTQPEIPPKKPFGFPAIWSCPPWTRRRRRLTFWL